MINMELLDYPQLKGRRRKAILNELELKEIKKLIDLNNTITIKAVKESIMNKFNKSCCYNIMKLLGFSYKIARKKHYKSDEVEQNSLKKTSK